MPMLGTTLSEWIGMLPKLAHFSPFSPNENTHFAAK